MVLEQQSRRNFTVGFTLLKRCKCLQMRRVRTGIAIAWNGGDELQGIEGEQRRDRRPGTPGSARKRKTPQFAQAMTAILQKLIDALRHELEQYGEMLALLEQQQEAAGLGAEDVLHTIAAINSQGASIQNAREQRKNCQRELSAKLNQPTDSSFAHLIPMVPRHYQGLLSALVQENNELLVRVRERALQNQALLRRSVEFMQQFISTLSSEETRHLHASNILTVEPSPPVYDAIA